MECDLFFGPYTYVYVPNGNLNMKCFGVCATKSDNTNKYKHTLLVQSGNRLWPYPTSFSIATKCVDS